MSAEWYITGPGGGAAVLLSEPQVQSLNITFRIMATSVAELQIHRDFDSDGAWWEAESIVTIFRAPAPGGTAVPFFTGRVQETPISADGGGEFRTLQLADAWQDLEEIIYQEAWAVGSGSVLIPKAVLGLDPAGEKISTGQQVAAAVAYAISESAALATGTIDAGVTVWPSEISNTSCADVILGEMRWNPNHIAWIDHSTVPPTFHMRARAALTAEAIDVAQEEVEAFDHARQVRSVPRGVRILYEDAAVIDDTVYRSGYLDTAGATTGRKIMQATIELAGLNVQLQKSRIETRTMPTDGPTMIAYFKKKWPELKDMPDGAFDFKNVKFALAPLADQPDPVCAKAPRLEVTEVAELPRELVRGQIEDWMRKKVGQVTVTYDLAIVGNPNPVQKKILDNFSGVGKTFTVTATNAVTKLYKGISSFTEGEGAPEGIAAAVYAAATAEKYEGSVTLSMEDVPVTTWLGKQISLHNGVQNLMPAMPLHSASMDIFNGSVQLSFGPLPYLTAGDFFELQRMVNRRPVTWMSQEERASNELGASEAPGAKGDTVSGYDFPQTTSPPGSGPTIVPFDPILNTEEDGEEVSYYVTVEQGVVVERDLTALENEEALHYYPCTNRLQPDLSLSQFAITAGQAIFVVVAEDIYGRIDTTVDVVLAVDDKNKKSLNTIPGIQGGLYYYKLAELVVESGAAKLKYFAARSNIYHESGLTADIVLETCPYFEPGATEATPGTQIFRGSFVSGKLAVVGKSQEERPFAETLERRAIDCEVCT